MKKLFKVDIYHLKKGLQKTSHGWGFEPATPTISPKIKKIYIKKNYADLYNRLNENTTDVGS